MEICHVLTGGQGEMQYLGERVPEAWESAALSQEQLAAELQLLGSSVTQKTISRIESGPRLVAD